MATVNVRDARERISQLLDRVQAGDEVVILRHGKPVARLTKPQAERSTFPDRSALRESLPPMLQSAAEMVRSLRDDERY